MTNRKNEENNGKRLYPYDPPERKVEENYSTEYVSYRDQLISRINNGGGWSDETFAREALEEYEERLRDDEERGSW